VKRDAAPQVVAPRDAGSALAFLHDLRGKSRVWYCGNELPGGLADNKLAEE
jgi:hypothetical protein